jgi:hypothetical protein
VAPKRVYISDLKLNDTQNVTIRGVLTEVLTTSYDYSGVGNTAWNYQLTDETGSVDIIYYDQSEFYNDIANESKIKEGLILGKEYEFSGHYGSITQPVYLTIGAKLEVFHGLLNPSYRTLSLEPDYEKYNNEFIKNNDGYGQGHYLKPTPFQKFADEKKSAKNAIYWKIGIALAVIMLIWLIIRGNSEPTAECNDNTTSYSTHASGTCSHHGGVQSWINDGSNP